MDDKHFDDIINEALNNFEAKDQSADWDSFSQRLDTELDESWDEFDQEIKDKLEGFIVPVPESAWDQFESKLDKSLYEEYAEELDQTVKSNLQNLHVPYDSSTWPVLENKLEERRAYIRKLVLTKSIEAAIVIFAIFTFYTYFPYYHQQYKNWKDSQITVVAEDNVQDMLRNEPIAEALVLEEAIDASLAQSTTQLSATSVEKSEDLINTNQKASDQFTAISSVDVTSATKSNRNLDIVTQISGHSFDKPRQLRLINEKPLALALSSIPSQSSKSAVDSNKDRVPSDRLTADLADDRIAMNAPPLSNNPNIHLASSSAGLSPSFNALDKVKKKAEWSIGIHGATDLNYVNIPQNNYIDHKQRTFAFLEKDLAEFGFGTGLSFQVRMGDLAVESGIHYSSKTYDPNKNYSPSDGYRQLDYSKISMEIIEVPVSVQYYWNSSGRLQLYALGGGSLNAVIAKYHDLLIPQPRSFGQPRTVEQDKEDQYAVLRVKSHFLEGAEDREYYFTINLGVGMEYQINKEYALFLEPIYKQQFLKKGIGPNNDKINTTSLKFGSRMTF